MGNAMKFRRTVQEAGDGPAPRRPTIEDTCCRRFFGRNNLDPTDSIEEGVGQDERPS